MVNQTPKGKTNPKRKKLSNSSQLNPLRRTKVAVPSRNSSTWKTSGIGTASSNHPLLFQRAAAKALESVTAALNSSRITARLLRKVQVKLSFLVEKHERASQIGIQPFSDHLKKIGKGSRQAIPLPLEVRRSLEDWGSFLRSNPSVLHQKAPITEKHILLGDFTCDASSTGVGIVYDSEYYGFWTVPPDVWLSIGRNIDVMEMIGVEMLVRAIVSMGQRNLALCCTCDNTSVCDILTGDRVPSGSPVLMASLQRIRELLSANFIELNCTWVPTEKNLADHISRGRETNLKRLPTYLSLQVPNGLLQAGFLGKEERKKNQLDRLKEIKLQREMQASRSPSRARYGALGGAKRGGVLERIQRGFSNRSGEKVLVDLTLDSDDEPSRQGNESQPVDLTVSDEEEEKSRNSREKGKGKAKDLGKISKGVVDLTTESQTDDEVDLFLA